MKLASFCILTVLSLAYAALTFTETAMYHAWERAVDSQKDIQTKVTYYQHLSVFIEQVLRRTALDAQHDPALAELLKRHKVKVVSSIPPSAYGAPDAAAAPSVPPIQDQAPPVPQTPTPSHQ